MSDELLFESDWSLTTGLCTPPDRDRRAYRVYASFALGDVTIGANGGWQAAHDPPVDLRDVTAIENAWIADPRDLTFGEFCETLGVHQ